MEEHLVRVAAAAKQVPQSDTGATRLVADAEELKKDAQQHIVHEARDIAKQLGDLRRRVLRVDKTQSERQADTSEYNALSSLLGSLRTLAAALTAFAPATTTGRGQSSAVSAREAMESLRELMQLDERILEVDRQKVRARFALSSDCLIAPAQAELERAEHRREEGVPG
jgi:electron transfer flavoprotein alpha subunit